jgi:hypothetical protein
MDNNSYHSSNADSQFVLSYELICLLQWLMDHDADKLKKMIDKALNSGLKTKLQKESAQLQQIGNLDEIQENIIEFFGLMEVLLVESLHDQAVKKALENNLMPSIDQIDSTVCDTATVRSCVERATSTMENNPQESPKELLFKELLRQWKPGKESALN